MMGEPAASDHQPSSAIHSQLTKVLALNDNHSHPANSEKPTTKLGQCTINFSNQDWQVNKNLFVYFSNRQGIINS